MLSLDVVLEKLENAYEANDKTKINWFTLHLTNLALKLHKEAEQSAKRALEEGLRNKSIQITQDKTEYYVFCELLANHLQTRLTQELPASYLSEPEVCHKLYTLINKFDPKVNPVQMVYLSRFQNVLREMTFPGKDKYDTKIRNSPEMLIKLSKIRKIVFACEEYQSYLRRNIVIDLAELNAQRLEQPILFEDLIASSETLNKTSKAIQLGIKKYKLVNHLHEIFHPAITDNKMADEKIKLFKEGLDKGFHLLSKNRDSATEKFLKVIATFFVSLSVVGFFFVPKIWQTRGKQFACEAKKVLPASSPAL